jgi:hypothetical protein
VVNVTGKDISNARTVGCACAPPGLVRWSSAVRSAPYECWMLKPQLPYVQASVCLPRFALLDNEQGAQAQPTLGWQ